MNPKARKVVVVKHLLLPLYKRDDCIDIIRKSGTVGLFCFKSPLAVGRITVLVVDSGHPIFAARPMFPQIQTTPIAGLRLTSHIRALLLMFATYLPPLSSLSAASNVPAANRATRVPQEILTDAVVEEIKTRCCFVGDVLGPGKDTRKEDTPGVEENPESEMDLPPSSDASASESDFSHSHAAMSQPDSEFFVVTGPAFRTGSHLHHAPGVENHLQAIATMYKRHSTATDIQMRVTPAQSGTGQGTLIIPGWIRERSAEVLFEGGVSGPLPNTSIMMPPSQLSSVTVGGMAQSAYSEIDDCFLFPSGFCQQFSILLLLRFLHPVRCPMCLFRFSWPRCPHPSVRLSLVFRISSETWNNIALRKYQMISSASTQIEAVAGEHWKTTIVPDYAKVQGLLIGCVAAFVVFITIIGTENHGSHFEAGAAQDGIPIEDTLKEISKQIKIERA